MKVTMRPTVLSRMVESSTIPMCSPWVSSGGPPVWTQDTPPPILRQSACKNRPLNETQQNVSTPSWFLRGLDD
jgi:hypothetical protein